MRRIAVVGAALACAAGVLAGCGSDSSDTTSTSASTAAATGTAASATAATDEKATITFSSYTGYKAGYEAVLENFKKAHPNITVKTTFLGDQQIFTLLPTQMSGGNGPDVLYAFPGSVLNGGSAILANAGLLKDQSAAPWAKDIIPSGLGAVSANGKPYAWLPDSSPAAIVYDKAKFDELGLTVPTTFDELLATCKAATEKGTTFLFESAYPSGLTAELTANWVEGADPGWVEQRVKGEVTFAGSEIWKNTLQKAIDMKDAGCFQKNPQANQARDTTLAAISQGKALAMSAGGSAIPILKKLNPKLDPQLMLMPGDSPEKTFITLVLSNSIAVNESTDEPEAAQTLIDFFAEPEQSDLFAKTNVGLSPSQAASGEWPAEFSAFQAQIDAGNVNGSLYGAMPNPETYNAFALGIVGLWTGQKTIDQVLGEMDKAWDAGAPKSK